MISAFEGGKRIWLRSSEIRRVECWKFSNVSTNTDFRHQGSYFLELYKPSHRYDSGGKWEVKIWLDETEGVGCYPLGSDHVIKEMKRWKSRSQWPRGLRPLERWDRGFESHSMHGCLYAFILCVVLCAGSGLATGWSLVQGVLPIVYGLGNWKNWPRSTRAVKP
jgi:hypothetical protein